MTITKANFNQIVELVKRLMDNDDLIAASHLADQAFDFYRELEDADTSDFDINEVILILGCTDWRTADSQSDYALLAEKLNNNLYWHDDFLESDPHEVKAGLLREKALAYGLLANNYATGALFDLYVEYAIAYIDQSIKQYEELIQSGEDLYDLYVDAKIKKAIILRLKSNNMARKYAISLFGQKLSPEDKEDLMKVYDDATDVLFDDYFAKKPIMTVQATTDIDEAVKDEVVADLLEAFAQPGNDDPYWWLFTHKITPEERKKILFVKNIEDASDNDFDEIPWVFTLDRYPFDIEFDGEKEPTVGVYEMDINDTNKYHRI